MPGDLPNEIAMLLNDIIAILSDQATKRAFSTSAQWANFFHEFLIMAIQPILIFLSFYAATGTSL
jgi:hypothetical protein